MVRKIPDPDIVTRETNKLTQQTSSFINDVIHNYIAPDHHGFPLRSTRNQTPTYTMNKTHKTIQRQARSSVTRKRVCTTTTATRNAYLTQKRKDAISDFLREVRAEPSKYGKVDSILWMKRLKQRLVDAGNSDSDSGNEGNQDESINAPVTTAVVKNWLKNPQYRDILDELRGGELTASSTSSGPSIVLDLSKKGQATVITFPNSRNSCKAEITAPNDMTASGNCLNQEVKPGTSTQVQKPASAERLVEKGVRNAEKKCIDTLPTLDVKCVNVKKIKFHPVAVGTNNENQVLPENISNVQVGDQPLENLNVPIDGNCIPKIPEANGNLTREEQQRPPPENIPQNYPLYFPGNAGVNMYNTALGTMIQTIQSQTVLAINAYNSLLQLGCNDPNTNLLGLQLSFLQFIVNRLGNQ